MKPSGSETPHRSGLSPPNALVRMASAWLVACHCHSTVLQNVNRLAPVFIALLRNGRLTKPCTKAHCIHLYIYIYTYIYHLDLLLKPTAAQPVHKHTKAQKRTAYCFCRFSHTALVPPRPLARYPTTTAPLAPPLVPPTRHDQKAEGPVLQKVRDQAQTQMQ
jgi:hypothetical protein